MSGAITALQAAVVEQLREDETLQASLTGIYDGPPARPAFPYVVIASSAATDWSHKTGTGREVSFGLALYVGEGDAALLHDLSAAAEVALAQPLTNQPGWTIVNFNFQRTRMTRVADGPWSALLDYRARLIQTT